MSRHPKVARVGCIESACRPLASINVLVFASGVLTVIFRWRWPWHFSLRSLFIATTFLAVVLGMIAWLDQAWIGK